MSKRNGIAYWIRKASPDQLVDGTLWYDKAIDHVNYLSETYGVHQKKVAGIIAATSTNTKWEDNLKRAEEYLKDGVTKHFGFIIDKCDRIMNSPIEEIPTILNGPKITNFYYNLIGDYQKVTIDRHAMRVLGRTKKPVGIQYKKAAAEYKRAATRLSNKYNLTIHPAQVQAIAWVSIRENS